jgi:hypothetical protein
MRSPSSRASFAVALAAAGGLGGCIQTSTYGTGESPEMAIFRELSGGLGGFGAEKKEPIVYQPRAPLVMPPAEGEALPPPVETAAVANPNWPRDPDQTAEGRREFGDENPRDDISPEEARRLAPLAGMGQTDWEPGWDENKQPAYDIVNKEKRDTFRAALDEAEGIRQERRYLTDLPDSVREPAPTAPAEFEDIKRERGFFLTRWITGG